MTKRWDNKRLVEEFRAGNQIALARIITLVENQRDGFEDILREIHRLKIEPWRIGVTGPPGAGKSTTVENLAALFRESDMTVGILAVDPSSPFSGGALLGDRVRMSRLNLDSGVYIRSLATRGSVGGLTATTEEVVHVMEVFGFDVVIIETVGVGQSELDIASQADSTIVILVPESGDSIQILKAGLIEIADILVVNKSDRAGAKELVADIGEVLEMRKFKDDWQERIIQTTASEGKGITQLKSALEEHREYLLSSDLLEAGRRKRVEDHVKRIVQRKIEDIAAGMISEYAGFENLIDRILRDEETPYQAAMKILQSLDLSHGGGKG